jgi:LPXTG-motif cell wall-anchored protein
VLDLVDGAPGDDDGVANGTIVDPGGPGNGPSLVVDPPTSIPATVPPPTPAPTIATPGQSGPSSPTMPAGTTLPVTGSDGLGALLLLATAALCAGAVLLVARRPRRLQRPQSQV